MTKKTFLFLLSVSFVLFNSCSNNSSEKLKHFVEDAIQLETEKSLGAEPISQMAIELEKGAEKTIIFNKSNIAEALQESKSFRKAYIVVGKHTLIKITSFDDCQKSTSWGVCMPKGTALTQKSGAFQNESDYINNLIGKPDDQVRKIYLFN